MEERDLLERFEAISALQDRAKRDFNQVFDTEEQAFLDLFLYGEFHEEEAGWCQVADALSKTEIANKALAVIHVLIAGRVDTRDGIHLKTIMSFYTTIRNWFLGHLESPDELLKVLAEVRVLVFAGAKEERSGWWVDTIRVFSLVEVGIRRRMGLHTFKLESEFDREIDNIVKR